jgi:hypothetical protein
MPRLILGCEDMLTGFADGVVSVWTTQLPADAAPIALPRKLLNIPSLGSELERWTSYQMCAASQALRRKGGLSLEEIESEAKTTTKKAKAAAEQERVDLATKHVHKIVGLMGFGLGLSRELVVRLVQLYKSESDPVGVMFNKLFSDGELPQLAARL